MAVRKHPTKQGWWQIIISHGRKQPQKVLLFQGTEAEARAYEAVVKGVPTVVSDSKVIDLLSRFLDWYVIHRSPKSNDGLGFALKRLLPILGDRYITLLHQNDYERYKASRLADKVSKRTINIELTYFRAFLRWCREEAGLSPGAGPKLFPKKDTQPKATIVPSKIEIEALLANLSGDKRTIARLMAWCGLRRDEALTLTRGNIDLSNRLLIITGKGNKTRPVPIIREQMYQDLWEACKKKKREDYLFVNKKTKEPFHNIRKALKSAAIKAGIDKRMYNHLLRHAFGTEAITAEVNLRALQTMLGHSDIRTTEIYTHMAAELIKTEAAKLAIHFGDKPPKKTPQKPRKKTNKSKTSEMSAIGTKKKQLK